VDGRRRGDSASRRTDPFVLGPDTGRLVPQHHRLPPAGLVAFAGKDIPFLSCTDLTVFKSFFNRTKDWADIEEMLAIGSVDRERVIGVLTLLLGADDDRLARFTRLCEGM
jgi:hypothetical protein